MLSPHKQPNAVSPFTEMQKVPPSISRWPSWHYSGYDGAIGMPVSAQPCAQMHSFQFSHLDECNKNDKPSSTLHISSVGLLISTAMTLPYST